MDRRQLLSLQYVSMETEQAEFSSARQNLPPLVQSGLTPYSGQWTEAEVKHLLRRTMFGATKADVNYFVSVGMNQAVTELLTPTAAPAPPLYTNTANYNDPNVAFGTTWVNAPYDSNANNYRLRSYRYWWISQMLNQTRSIQEKMVVFWHNHFSTETAVVQDARYCYNYNALLRQYALGNFKALTKAITLDPAMLIYLNGYLNKNTKPDENYGRELQELFTVGKDANGNPYYTEPDVQNAAKVLTGYRINATNATSYFDSTKHDTTNKTFSAYYNNTVITGQTGNAGANELDDLLTMIFATQQPALFICRKLYRFFMYYTIDSQIEADVIEPMATILRSSNYDIVPALQAFFTSEHFYDAANTGSLIKTPIDFVVSLCRDFNVQFPTSAALIDQYGLWGKLQTYASLMGQIIGDPPNVAGWPAFYQEPQYHEIWVNTTTLPNRNIFTDTMCYAGFKSGSSKIFIDVVAYTASLDNPSDPNLLIQEAIDRHLSVDVSANVKKVLKDFLLNGQISDYYWSSAWSDYVNNPSNMTYYTTVQTRLQAMFKYLMDLSEYQLS